MNARDMLTGRRSIRSYQDKPVTREQIEEILSLARYAPSWKNSQTVRYNVIADKELKQKVAEEGVMGHANNCRIIKEAPVLVVVSTVEGISGFDPDGSFTTSKGTHWQSFDAGIATQTFCLAAYECGLATLIMGIFDDEAVRKILGLPEGEAVSALVALGYGAVSPDGPKRKETEELMRFCE